jgi:hypothetical protein
MVSVSMAPVAATVPVLVTVMAKETVVPQVVELVLAVLVTARVVQTEEPFGTAGKGTR